MEERECQIDKNHQQRQRQTGKKRIESNGQVLNRDTERHRDLDEMLKKNVHSKMLRCVNGKLKIK